MATYAHGRCPSCRRRYSVLPNRQIHPHKVTVSSAYYGRAYTRIDCPGGEAIDIDMPMTSTPCDLCGQIVRTDKTDAPMPHKTADGRRRCNPK